MMKYRKIHVLKWRVVYVLKRGLFPYLFNNLHINEGIKHQNNPRVSA